MQDGGSDWRILRVLDVATGKPLADEIRWAKFTGLAWVGEEGFLYSRFPEPEEGAGLPGAQLQPGGLFPPARHAAERGRAGLRDARAPRIRPQRRGHHDGRWAVITSSIGTDARYEVRVIDLAARGDAGLGPPLVTGFDNAWNLIDAIGGTLWFVTNKDAPRYRLVAIDLDAPTPTGARSWPRTRSRSTARRSSATSWSCPISRTRPLAR